jgi:hypothetical protein
MNSGYTKICGQFGFGSNLGKEKLKTSTIVNLIQYESKTRWFATLYMHLDRNNDMYRYNLISTVPSKL